MRICGAQLHFKWHIFIAQISLVDRARLSLCHASIPQSQCVFGCAAANGAFMVEDPTLDTSRNQG